MIIKQILLLVVVFCVRFSCYATIDSMVVALENTKSNVKKVQLSNEIAQELLLKNPKRAIVFCNMGISLKVHNVKNLDLAPLYKTKGTAHLYLGEYDSTKFYWMAYLDVLPSDAKKELADGYNNLGVYFQTVNNADSSLHYHKKALALRTQLNQSVDMAKSMNNMAVIYRKKGDLKKALHLYNKALKMYQKHDKKKEIADVLVGLGLIHRELKNYTTSINYFKESLSINESLNNVRGICNSYNNIGAAYLNVDNDSLAEIYFLKAEELSAKLGDPIWIHGIQINLAVIYKRRGEIKRSIIHYEKALGYFEAREDRANLAITQNNLGYLYQKTNDYNTSIDYFRMALSNATATDNIDVLINAHKGLSNSLKSVGQFEEALEQFTMFSTIQDSLKQSELIEQVAKYQELYESEKRIKEIKALKHNALIKEAQANTDRMYRNGLIVLAFLLIVLVVIAVSRFRLKKKVLVQKNRLMEDEKEAFRLKSALAEKEIELRNRELSSLSVQSMNKNELLHSLSEKLSTLKHGKTEELEQSIFELERQIKSSFNLDKDWEIFQKHFTNVHPGFFDDLKSQFPNLSSNDLRICAYIKMNLSTKEISTLMNITPKSTRMSKYRLKKKLNLLDGQDLQEFISGDTFYSV